LERLALIIAVNDATVF